MENRNKRKSKEKVRRPCPDNGCLARNRLPFQLQYDATRFQLFDSCLMNDLYHHGMKQTISGCVYQDCTEIDSGIWLTVFFYESIMDFCQWLFKDWTFCFPITMLISSARSNIRLSSWNLNNLPGISRFTSLWIGSDVSSKERLVVPVEFSSFWMVLFQRQI